MVGGLLARDLVTDGLLVGGGSAADFVADLTDGLLVGGENINNGFEN
ncbi:MAG: hypothetical protein HC789_14105 [Microcoleus sp. CSU_2_2]|nr:hypothetical protein [Microcoleus sp. SU_5_3]NJS11419.1 hypothetical protein [Microcoleus sp. CSU_2_2]